MIGKSVSLIMTFPKTDNFLRVLKIYFN